MDLCLFYSLLAARCLVSSYIYLRACIHTYMYVHTYTHVGYLQGIYIYLYTHTHTHTHTYVECILTHIITTCLHKYLLISLTNNMWKIQCSIHLVNFVSVRGPRRSSRAKACPGKERIFNLSRKIY